MKQKYVKRLCATLLAGVMAVGCLAACGQTETQKSEETKQSSESKQENTDSKEDTAKKEEPVTLELFVHGIDVSADELWIYKYLQWWLGEQGHDVTFDINQPSSADYAQQRTVLLGTGDLPDLSWGSSLAGEEVVMYGCEEKMLLDWTPYLNKEDMPNLMALFEKYPNALAASTAPDGGVYALPHFIDGGWGTIEGSLPYNCAAWMNQAWLDQIGWETYPTTVEEFLEMARAMKEFKHPDGIETWPVCVSADTFLFNLLIWLPSGYYGGWGSRYGTSFLLKDGEVVLGCYEEEYRDLVTLFNTMYEEELIHPDFLTLDGGTNFAMQTAGHFGVMVTGGDVWDASSTNPYGEGEYMYNSVMIDPLSNGSGHKALGNLNKNFSQNRTWASADTEHVELVVKLVDYLYSPEGGTTYNYGPMEGEDPLGLVSGWYWDAEKGEINSKDNNTDSWWAYVDATLRPYSYVFSRMGEMEYLLNKAGVDIENEDKSFVDGVTGQTIVRKDYNVYNESTACKTYWMEEWNEWAYSGHVTEVFLPSAYLSVEEATRVAELKTVINEYVNAESAKFIVGDRPLEEVDAFWAELKDMGIEEYIQIYRDAYAPFIEATFGK